MRVHPFAVPILLLIALLGTVFSAQAAGIWSTSGRDSIDVTHMTADDIKGWMTLQQVIDGLGISGEELYAAAGIVADVPPETALKDLEAIVPGFSISNLRAALATQTAAATAMPTAVPAAPVAAATPTPGATPTTPIGSGTGTGPTPLPPGQILAADQIKAKITLRDVSQQCALPLNSLLAALNLPGSTNPDVAIKDLIAAGQLSDVTDVQTAVARMQMK